MESSVAESASLDRANEFWNRLEEVRAGMLGLEAAHRMVPMTHYTEKTAGILWFIGADGTDIVNSVSVQPRDAHYVLTSASEGLYANMIGTLALEEDAAKLDEIWNAVASSWFEGGRRDPDVRLLRFQLTEAEVWSTTTSKLSFAYEIAKAKMTDKKPDVGNNYVLVF
jgi:general stress protein 26